MSKTYQITIEGLKDPKKFVREWSAIYDYKDEYKYTDNINTGLESDIALMKLFEWKNGTSDKISDQKIVRVNEFISKREELKLLKKNFSLEKFEELIEPNKGSVIWKIFLLHIVQPERYPIYDQHVYRSFRFFKTGELDEISQSDKKKYNTYKNEYVDWFNALKEKYDLNPREMDKSFFMYGRMLKLLNSKPVEIYELGV